MSTDNDQELEAFKSRIDLQSFAASLGYEKNKPESSKRSAIINRENDSDENTPDVLIFQN